MLGKLKDLNHLVHANSRLKRGLDLLEDCVAGHFPEVTNAIATLSPGETSRIWLEGDAFYLLVQCYQPRTRDQGRFEAHERHTDLQFLWSGRECIEVCDLHASLPAAAYDKNGNVYFPLGNQPHSRLLLHAGEVAVLLPEDAHAACLSLGGDGEELVRKIVVKIQDAHLLEAAETGKSMAASKTPGPARVTPALVTATSNPNRAAAR
jgi:YhcH/YjgK/YiaL family protein